MWFIFHVPLTIMRLPLYRTLENVAKTVAHHNTHCCKRIEAKCLAQEVLHFRPLNLAEKW